MDISLAIKSGYYENLSYGLNIPVYDAFAVPSDATYPYVIIASIQPIEELNSKCKSWDVAVTLDIVTGFTSPKGMKQAFEISGLIEEIINPASRVQIDLSPYGYQIGQTRSNSVPNQFWTNNYWIYRSIKTFSHKIWPI
jgi:hypothetical protein